MNSVQNRGLSSDEDSSKYQTVKPRPSRKLDTEMTDPVEKNLPKIHEGKRKRYIPPDLQP